VFNQHGTEILASYSSESLYLLNPKQTLSQEQSQENLTKHRHDKQERTNIAVNKMTVNKTQDNESESKQDKKASHIKRLRLRGDWSDTGNV
jgi:hypothetical protein